MQCDTEKNAIDFFLRLLVRGEKRSEILRNILYAYTPVCFKKLLAMANNSNTPRQKGPQPFS